MTPLLVLLGTIAGAWYLLIVRPQKDQQTRHGRLVDQLQVGDHVLTVGGIYGRVVALESSTVVLELAPGLTSRIATDGIARIVHAGEAALPQSNMNGGAPAPANPHVTEDDMHQHQHQQYDQPPQYEQPPQYAMPRYQPPSPAPMSAPMPQTTIRAQVTQPVPTWEPRPWRDMQPSSLHAPVPAPVPAPAPMIAPMPLHAPPPPSTYAPPPPSTYAPPAQIQQPAAVMYQQPAMPLHVPFATAPVPATPVAAPVVQALQHAVPPQAPPAPDTRTYSRAPKGMGSSLRLDDPSLRDTIARARSERAELAQEYRRVTAPLVDVDAPAQSQPQLAAAAQPQLVGHDPSGIALFATPGAAGVHPIAHYPAPAQIPQERAPSPVPRPHVIPPDGAVDPALQGRAFQRPTPYAPVRAEAAAAAPVPPPIAAHA